MYIYIALSAPGTFTLSLTFAPLSVVRKFVKCVLIRTSMARSLATSLFDVKSVSRGHTVLVLSSRLRHQSVQTRKAL